MATSRKRHAAEGTPTQQEQQGRPAPRTDRTMQFVASIQGQAQPQHHVYAQPTIDFPIEQPSLPQQPIPQLFLDTTNTNISIQPGSLPAIGLPSSSDNTNHGIHALAWFHGATVQSQDERVGQGSFNIPPAAATGNASGVTPLQRQQHHDQNTPYSDRQQYQQQQQQYNIMPVHRQAMFVRPDQMSPPSRRENASGKHRNNFDEGIADDLPTAASLTGVFTGSSSSHSTEEG